MEHFKKIACPHCGCEDLQKNGKSPNGTQRFGCKGCKKSFRLAYTYRACQPGVKQEIDNQILNSSGVRDVGRNLGIDKDTVVRHLKKSGHAGKPVY